MDIRALELLQGDRQVVLALDVLQLELLIVAVQVEEWQLHKPLITHLAQLLTHKAAITEEVVLLQLIITIVFEVQHLERNLLLTEVHKIVTTQALIEEQGVLIAQLQEGLLQTPLRQPDKGRRTADLLITLEDLLRIAVAIVDHLLHLEAVILVGQDQADHPTVLPQGHRALVVQVAPEAHPPLHLDQEEGSSLIIFQPLISTL